MKFLNSAISLGLLLLTASGGVARADEAPEYQVKAAFLYNFAKFVDWPDAAFANGSPFVIGILGDDPFGESLDKTVDGKSAGDRKIVVRRYKNADDAKACHIVYVSRSQRKQLGKDLEKLEKTNALLVGDTEQFINHGGMINFVIEEKKVRLEINPEAAEKAGLKVSSKLLQLARIIKAPRRS